jgi:hypothetical protein
VSLVFAADLAPAALVADDWRVSFAGMTLNSTSVVGIDFSTDGISYTEAGTVTLTTTDTRYELALAQVESDQAFVRFRFDPESGTEFPIIDNVAITVPETGASAQLLAAAAGLVACTVRRGASARRA